MTNITFDVSCADCAGPNCSASFSDSYDARNWADRHECNEAETAEYEAQFWQNVIAHRTANGMEPADPRADLARAVAEEDARAAE
ncbi:MAG: hypothetical protein JWL77_7075 [Chthonomonadaceae bacterium]|nr:hypothetical protein [Chthonomonadaceae bacterium]